MTAARELICFGEDWGRHPTTAQFLVRELLGSFRVIWINSLGWRMPRPCRDDVVRVLGKVRAAARGVETPHANLVVHTPLVVPWYRSALVQRLNARLLQATLHRLVRTHGFSRYSLMTTYPAAEGVFDLMRGVRRIYYCADEYTTLPGLDARLVRQLEDRLLKHVDVVVTPSRALHEAKSRRHPRVVHLPHAVDVEHFSRAADPATAIPDDLKGLSRPIIGFHGLVQDLIDMEIIEGIARRRPEWSVVLIGRRNFDVGTLPRRHNIHYLGERSHEDIPAYVRGFDVCLIPYKVVPRTIYANPVKLREYLAAGKPIVSTPLPEVCQFGRLVRVAESADGFVTQIEESLVEPASLSADRRASVREQTWASRARDLAQLL